MVAAHRELCVEATNRVKFLDRQALVGIDIQDF